MTYNLFGGTSYLTQLQLPLNVSYCDCWCFTSVWSNQCGVYASWGCHHDCIPPLRCRHGRRAACQCHTTVCYWVPPEVCLAVLHLQAQCSISWYRKFTSRLLESNIHPTFGTAFSAVQPVFAHLVESPGFFLKFSGPGTSWKMSLVLQSPGIYLWFNLTNMLFMYRTPCVNKCMKYSCCLLTELVSK